ncbi:MULTISPECIES: peptidylprolyl isomerase, partial [unclassified Paraburkholderia]|uniref:peptidylprolyl isomerase n=1 Tax=unclassified Paraburkholderia TaxID=2615204 RepID=UPI002AB299E9
NDEDSAKKVLAALKTGQPFADLARQYSIAPSKTAGGSLPWVSYKLPATDGHTQGLPLALAQAIAQLPSGAVTPQPLHIGNVYVIARLDAKRSTEVPDFTKSKETLRLQLRNAEAQKAAIEFSRQQLNEAKIIE